MKDINSYRNLVVWQKSMDLVSMIYVLTDNLPKSEICGLISQMRRAVVAIPSNIAEGQTRNYPKEFLQFLYISYGSGAELETQLEICRRLHKLNNLSYNKTRNLLSESMRMLSALITSLKNTNN